MQYQPPARSVVVGNVSCSSCPTLSYSASKLCLLDRDCHVLEVES